MDVASLVLFHVKGDSKSSEGADSNGKNSKGADRNKRDADPEMAPSPKRTKGNSSVPKAKVEKCYDAYL